MEKLEDIISGYYSKLFASDKPTEEPCRLVLGEVDKMVSLEMNEMLMRPFSNDEILETIKQNHCKAPRPDGMHAIFYQCFWHLVGDEVTEFVSNILHNFSSPSRIDSTNINLIQKVKSPTFVSEF